MNRPSRKPRKPYNPAPPKHVPPPQTDEVRLNKYIANAGVCSRREADKLIEAGYITINGKVVTALGTKVKPRDKVTFKGKLLRNERLVYVLLNKPKGFISTADDPQGRKTVLDLVRHAGEERLYPVGRLDRATTGLLLLTNDGELTKKLTHPSHNVRKVYHVVTNIPVTQAHLEQLVIGVELEDGPAKADVAAFVGDGDDPTQIGLELHSGRNRVVRRMLEALGYDVIRLDRVAFAGLTKKKVPRGKWRFLTEKEIGQLKMIR